MFQDSHTEGKDLFYRPVRVSILRPRHKPFHFSHLLSMGM